MPRDICYASLEDESYKGDRANESSIPAAAKPLLRPDDKVPTNVNQMPSSDYENIHFR